MTESLQIILLIMLVIVIIFFIVLGVQVFFLLQDARKTITKANQVLDNTNSITDSISEPLSAISGMMSNVNTGSLITKALKIAVNIISKSDTKKSRKERNDES